jgi:CheY-like chemotaxis protein
MSAARRVLLVEDAPDCRETTRLVLESWGHTVEVAEDGAAGLAKALAWHPEVGIFDIGMPGMDGFELARKVRQAKGDALVLIALTGYCTEKDRIKALGAGFDHHMGKPADFDLLYQLLRRAPPGGAQ